MGSVNAGTGSVVYLDANILIYAVEDLAVYEHLLDPAGPLGVRAITRPILTRAAELRAAHTALKLPDAIHAATALLDGCTTFLTNDGRFAVVPPLPVLLLSQLP